jgi:CBS domain-containing protein
VDQIGPSDTTEHARTLMRLRGVHHLVVVEHRTVKGFATAQQLAADRRALSAAVGDQVVTNDCFTVIPPAQVIESIQATPRPLPTRS